MEQKKQKNQTTTYLLAALVIIAVAGIFLSKKKNSNVPVAVAPATLPDKPSEIAHSQPPTAPLVAQQAPPAAKAPPAYKAKSARTGLCSYEMPTNEVLFTDKDYRRIRKKSAFVRYVALPVYHGGCLKNKTSSVRARIVSYEQEADMAYDYHGSFNVQLRHEKDFKNFSSLVLEFGQQHEAFGFSNPEEMVIHYAKTGAAQADAFALFEIVKADRARIRQMIGSYNFYPGALVKTAAEIRAEYKMSDLLYISLDNPPIASIPLPPLALSIKTNLISGAIANPSLSINHAPEDKLASLPKDKTLVLIGFMEAELKTYNLVPLLRKLGFRRIVILRDGYVGLAGWNLRTPETVSGLTTISLNDLVSKYAKYTVVDVRPSKDPNRWRLRWAALASIEFSRDARTRSLDFHNFHTTKKLQGNHNLARQLWLPSLIEASKKKPLLFIGNSELDWRPIVLFDELKKLGLTSASWYRAGIADLVARNTLEILDDVFKRQLTHGPRQEAKDGAASQGVVVAAGGAAGSAKANEKGPRWKTFNRVRRQEQPAARLQPVAAKKTVSPFQGTQIAPPSRSMPQGTNTPSEPLRK